MDQDEDADDEGRNIVGDKALDIVARRTSPAVSQMVDLKKAKEEKERKRKKQQTPKARRLNLRHERQKQQWRRINQ